MEDAIPGDFFCFDHKDCKDRLFQLCKTREEAECQIKELIICYEAAHGDKWKPV